MAVYVDDIIVYPGAKPPFHRGSCHMTADTLDELHAAARAIGMRRSWFQDHKLAPHYDLTPARRADAVRLGAVEETCREGVLRRRAARVAEGGR
ncbi:MAG: DUF4031 domain-containing protein [Candidatus Fermentibacter sp.]|nr:DUF4031 domain-containing protein [Candidatus Fermentibacter sp.]